jgi:hypothetical protein
MNWLARLKKTEVSPDTDPTKPTKPPFVGFVGTPAGTFENSRGESAAANDATADPDRWCWPHSAAMNTAEIDTFTARLHQFTGRSLAAPEAALLADKLVTRDRESDDRRLCLECLHLKSGGRWGCNQWQRAGLGAAGLPADLVRQLQRCDSFMEATT